MRAVRAGAPSGIPVRRERRSRFPECDTGDRALLEARRRGDCRTEIRRGVRLGGDAEDLYARPRLRRAGADALAVQDVQLRVRALPQDAREISPRDIRGPRPDVV